MSTPTNRPTGPVRPPRPDGGATNQPTGPIGPGGGATNQPTGNPGAPWNQPKLPSTEDRLKGDLDAYDREISAFNSRIRDLQEKVNGAQKGGRYEWLLPQYKAQLQANQDQLAQLQEARSKVQNKVWESTGQYDKLLAGTERDAFMAVNALFKNYGLDTLAPKVFEYVKNGYSADTISILLQDTPEYKQRFIGNEARKKAGLPVLSPAEYLATESAYKQVMQSAGLPKGFYDQPTDFADFLGRNVSPTEVQSRVDMAVRATTLAPDNVKQALKQMGIGEGEMVSYWLDKEKSLPFLKKAEMTAQIGAQALGQSLTFDQQYAAQLAQQGITGQQAQQGYSAIAQELTKMQTLGSIYGAQWNQRTSEQAMFEGNATALEQKRRLASQERGSFSGGAGTARGGLARRGGAQ